MTADNGTSVKCVFCDIALGLAPAEIVCHWPDALAFAPLNPVVPGHLHGQEDYAGRGLNYNVITSAGPFATQTVLHLHVHLVPRHRDDGLKLPWSDQ